MGTQCRGATGFGHSLHPGVSRIQPLSRAAELRGANGKLAIEERPFSPGILLARAMMAAGSAHSDLEPFTCYLSITTFRFVPQDLDGSVEDRQGYLNELNEALLRQLQDEGEVFLSNAILHGDYALRACIVNFRTSLKDVKVLPGIVARIGRELDSRLLP